MSTEKKLKILRDIMADRPALFWLLFALAVRLVAGTALHLYSVASGLEGFYPLLSGADDRMYWSQALSLLSGVTPDTTFSYSYVLAALFALVGPSLIAGKLLSVVAGSLVVYIGVLIAMELAAGRGSIRSGLRHPVHLTGLLLSFYPSAVLHSTQLLRDSLIVLFGILAVYCVLPAVTGMVKSRLWLCYGLALTFFYALRPYAAFALAFGLTLYLVYLRRKPMTVFVSLLAALIAPWLAGWGPFAWQYVVPLLAPETVSSFREEVYAIGGSAIGVTVEFTSVPGFLWTYPYSYLTAMFGPFLWQIRNQVMVIGLLESLPVLLLLPVWAKGVWQLLLRKGGSAGFLLLLSLLIIGAIALFSANIGANIRLRLLPWTVFLIYAALRLGKQPAQA